METRIIEIAERIKGLREMSEITPKKMAGAVGVGVAEYLEHEEGRRDFNFHLPVQMRR